MILWFSGTGNSEYIAKIIAEKTGDELVSINDKLKKGDCSDISAQKLVFVTPTHGWRIPRIVEEWIDKTQFPQDADAWFVMSCGSEIGLAEKGIKKLCLRKGFNCKGVAEIIMPENYIAMFDAPEEAEAREIIKAAQPAIDSAADCIAAGKALASKKTGIVDSLKSGIVNSGFYAICVKDKAFTVDDKCISCGKCAALCPVNNIELKDGRPVWNGKCVHCMACICSCPTEAIEYGSKSKGKPRYTCPV